MCISDTCTIFDYLFFQLFFLDEFSLQLGHLGSLLLPGNRKQTEKMSTIGETESD
jgi:hypothetical protein